MFFEFLHGGVVAGDIGEDDSHLGVVSLQGCICHSMADLLLNGHFGPLDVSGDGAFGEPERDVVGRGPLGRQACEPVGGGVGLCQGHSGLI